jgi:L-fucose isomerase-like protein
MYKKRRKHMWVKSYLKLDNERDVPILCNLDTGTSVEIDRNFVGVDMKDEVFAVVCYGASHTTLTKWGDLATSRFVIDKLATSICAWDLPSEIPNNDDVPF